MDRLLEQLERDAVCRAALAMWLHAGAPAGQLMSVIPAAEDRIRARTPAKLNSCNQFNPFDG
jgi:hypothetical protein